jgi:hypothetical protein
MSVANVKISGTQVKIWIAACDGCGEEELRLIQRRISRPFVRGAAIKDMPERKMSFNQVAIEGKGADVASESKANTLCTLILTRTLQQVLWVGY